LMKLTPEVFQSACLQNRGIFAIETCMWQRSLKLIYNFYFTRSISALRFIFKKLTIFDFKSSINHKCHHASEMFLSKAKRIFFCCTFPLNSTLSVLFADIPRSQQQQQQQRLQQQE